MPEIKKNQLELSKKEVVYKIGDRIDITTDIKISAIPKLEDGKVKSLVRRKTVVVKKALDYGEVEVLVSNSGLDRHGERILVEGIDLTAVKQDKNPSLLWSHQYSELPLGQITKIWKSKGDLMARIKLDYEIYSFADIVYKMILKGTIRSVSIGGLVLEFGKDKDDGDKTDYSIIAKLEMLELSIVNVGAHPDALVTSKSLNMKTDDLRASYEDFVLRSLVDKVKIIKDNEIGYHIKALKNLISALESASQTSQDTEKVQPKRRIRRLVVMRQAARQCDKQSEMIISAVNKLLKE